MALKENYKDDILDVSQNVKRKYQMENNGDGTVSFTDVTKYTQQGDSFGASDMNATNTKVNALESDIGEINDNLSGFKFYPTGTELVALVADNSFYTDANGKYILADSTTGQSMIDNVTYKALASTEDCRGEEGADTGIPFNQESELLYQNKTGSYSQTFSIPKGVKKIILVADHTEYGTGGNITITGDGVVSTSIVSRQKSDGDHYSFGFYTVVVTCSGIAFNLSVRVAGAHPTAESVNNYTVVYLG